MRYLGPQCLNAHQVKFTPGRGLASILTKGFLVTFNHKQLSAMDTIWYLDFTKSSMTSIR